MRLAVTVALLAMFAWPERHVDGNRYIVVPGDDEPCPPGGVEGVYRSLLRESRVFYMWSHPRRDSSFAVILGELGR